MSVIEVKRVHGMSHEAALDAAEKLARDLADRFDVHYDWQGEDLHFHRTGVRGYLRVEQDILHLRLELGLMLRPLKSRIESEIHSQLDQLTATRQA